jgi:toxin ParE1/3/4
VTRVALSPAAEGDLEDIWLTIAVDDPASATRTVQAIGARIDGLSQYPRLGPRRPDIRPATRMLVVRSYLVLYETHPDTDDGPITEVEVVRVVDGRRDLMGPF